MTRENILLFNNNKFYESINKIDSLFIRPSDVLERHHRRHIEEWKRCFTRLVNNGNIEQFNRAVANIKSTATTVGMTIRTDTDSYFTCFDKSGFDCFNLFNSHQVSFEIHTDIDLLLFLAVFLKHNCLWDVIPMGVLNHDVLDYVTLFFKQEQGSSEGGSRSFYVYDTFAAIIPRCREPVPTGTAAAASNDNSSNINNEKNYTAARRLLSINTHNQHCIHGQESQIRLGEKEKCLSCFCHLFFMVKSSVVIKRRDELQSYIENCMEKYVDQRLIIHLDRLSDLRPEDKLGPDFKFWNLIF